MTNQGKSNGKPEMSTHAYDEDENSGHENQSHICRGYVEPEQLQLNHITIARATDAGLRGLLTQFSIDCMENIRLIEAQEYSYGQLSQIVDILKNEALPILEMYCTPDIQIGKFESPEDGSINSILLSQTQRRIIIVTMTLNGSVTVRPTNSEEIWRYLYEPSKIVENVISILIAVAEQHRSIKDEWIHSFQKIKDLCKNRSD